MSTDNQYNRAIALILPASALCFSFAAACGGPSQPATTGGTDAVNVPAPPDGGGLSALPSPDAGSATSSANTDAGTPPGGSFFSNGAKLCGCKLCEPKLSDDACSTDADCAPSSGCHATSCIAASKVPPTTTRPICTRIMMCATTDANACTCYQGKCALTPRP